MEAVTTITVPVRVKEKLESLKISKRQAHYEVIEALVAYFEKNARDKTELWVQDDEGKK